jgi:hypothetical protein
VIVRRAPQRASHVSTALMKALLMYLDAEKGVAVADGWLRAARTVRTDLDDETRSVPRTVLHAGLRSFVELTSRDAVIESGKYLLVPQNLGFWVRILRGAENPCDAYARLDTGQAEYGRTMHWEVVEAHNGVWRGHVHLRHDPDLEKDGLLTLNRAALLSAVPALFGFERAQVTARAALSSTDPTEVVQEFEARWKVPSAAKSVVGAAVVGGALASGLALATHSSTYAALGITGLGLAAGAMSGVIALRERMRLIAMRGQSMRVSSLERNLVLQETRSRSATGQVVGSIVAGEYRILRPMGAGASGVIYEARRMRDDLPVALKLLRAAAAHESVASDRLRREAEALGLAWHPNVVEVIDHGHLPDGTAYLVLELLFGESLNARLRTKKKLTEQELLPIALQVCDALAAVHAAGVIHRDIKPGNIFLERIDVAGKHGGERVKVVDFGIARVEWEETRITNIGSPVGTPGYMSPEQEAGIEVDARSDLFALGASLYECLVGDTPPPTPSGLWLVASSEAAPATGPRASQIKSALREASPEWRALIERALMPNPDDRFQDARAFGQALRGLSREATTPESATS